MQCNEHGIFSTDNEDMFSVLRICLKKKINFATTIDDRWLPYSKSLDFQRQCDDLEAWMDEVEGHLASEDHGRDVITVQNLLKKHQV